MMLYIFLVVYFSVHVASNDRFDSGESNLHSTQLLYKFTYTCLFIYQTPALKARKVLGWVIFSFTQQNFVSAERSRSLLCCTLRETLGSSWSLNGTGNASGVGFVEINLSK